MRATMPIPVRRSPLVALALLTLVGTPALAADWTLRVGLGRAASRDTVVADTSCLSTAPPALFGCGVGTDGRRLSARGDFGAASAGEVALGAQVRRDLRLEVAAFAFRGFELAADANFVRVAGEQPVRADLDSAAVLAVVYWEPLAALGGRRGRWTPFVGAGVGGARHRLGRVTFRFPGIAANAVTVTGGGTEQDGAWLLTAGTGVRVGARTTLEVAWRRLDLGGAETDAGAATIVRPSRTFALRVAPIRARLRADEVAIGLRLGF